MTWIEVRFESSDLDGGDTVHRRESLKDLGTQVQAMQALDGRKTYILRPAGLCKGT